MGYYFWRATGSPLNSPYLVDYRTYSSTPPFPWQPLRPPPRYHHAVMQDFFGTKAMDQYEKSQSHLGMVKIDLIGLGMLWEFYLGAALTVPLVVATATLPYGFTWRDVGSSTRFLLLVCGMLIAGSMLPIFFLPHYAAPITCAILALVLQAMRRLRSQPGRGQPAGLFIARAAPLICMLMLALRVGVKPLHLPEPRRWLQGGAPIWCGLAPTNLERAATLAELRQYPGRQLAIVLYGPHHDNSYHEWVYNEADVDQAKVVWARDMGPAQNKELIDYFRNRHVWLVEADDAPPRVLPYGASP